MSVGFERGWPYGRGSVFLKARGWHSFRALFLAFLSYSCPYSYAQAGEIEVRMESREFVWGRGALDKKPHLVRWLIVCADKTKGGLGVRCLSKLNRALLCKCIW